MPRFVKRKRSVKVDGRLDMPEKTRKHQRAFHPCWLLELPHDLLNCVIQFLCVVDILASLRSTCKPMRALLQGGFVISDELRLVTPEQAHSFYAQRFSHCWQGKQYVRGHLTDSDWHMFPRLSLMIDDALCFHSSIFPMFSRSHARGPNLQVCTETLELVVSGEAIDISKLPVFQSLKKLDLQGGELFESDSRYSLREKCRHLESLAVRGTISSPQLFKGLDGLKHLSIKMCRVDIGVLKQAVIHLAPQLVSFELGIRPGSQHAMRPYVQEVKSLSWPRLKEYKGFEQAIPILPKSNRYSRLVLGYPSILLGYRGESLDQERICQLLQGHRFDVLVLPEIVNPDGVYPHDTWLRIIKESKCKKIEFQMGSLKLAITTLFYCHQHLKERSLVVSWPAIATHRYKASGINDMVQCFFQGNRLKCHGDMCCCFLLYLNACKLILPDMCDPDSVNLCHEAGLAAVMQQVIPSSVRSIITSLYTFINLSDRKIDMSYPLVEECFLVGGLFAEKEKINFDHLLVMFPNLQHVYAVKSVWALDSGQSFRNKYHVAKQPRWIKCCIIPE